MIVAAITGPAPNTLVTVVQEALTAAASFFFTSRRWPSRWRKPANSSAASSQRAWPAAPAGRIWARIFPARPAVISPATPPGTSPQHHVQPAGDLVVSPGQVTVPLRPHLEHRGVIISGHLPVRRRPQRRDRNR
jgi:hypothetical protein